MEGKCLESAGASNRVSPPVGAALSLSSKASSLSARKEFPVLSHREFIRNYLILRLIPISVSSPKAQKRRNSLFFSLLAGNSARQRPVWQDYVHHQEVRANRPVFPAPTISRLFSALAPKVMVYRVYS